MIGSLGDVVFETSALAVRTFSEMTWELTAKYAEHERHLKHPLPEFTGNELDTITFDMHLSAYLGVNPTEHLTKLITYMREGRTLPLIIGEKAYGVYRWVITKLHQGLKRFDNRGNLLEADVTVTLKMYPEK